MRKDGQIQNIERQVFDLLELLLANPDRVVTKDEIIDVVWEGRIISDAAINSRISTLRSALGDDGRSQRLIKTIHNKGLRFVGDILADPKDEPTPVVPQDNVRPIQTRQRIFLAALSAIAVMGLAFFAGRLSTPDPAQNRFQPWAPDDFEGPDTAIHAYQRGIALRQKQSGLANLLARQQFELAIENAPDFAAAYAGLAEVKAAIFTNDPQNEDVYTSEIDRNMDQALALNPESFDVQHAQGMIAFYNGQFERAISIADQLIGSEPQYLKAYILRGHALYALGRFEEAEEALGRALSLDPLSNEILFQLSQVKLALGDALGAQEAATANYWWNQDSVLSHQMMAKLALNTAQYEKAYDYLDKARSLNSGDSETRYALIQLFHDLDMPQERNEVAQTKVQQALVKAMQGERADVDLLLGGLSLRMTQADTHYRLRDFEVAAARYNIFLSHQEMTETYVGQGLLTARMCFVYGKTNNPLKDRICSKLAAFYDGKAPQDFLLRDDVLGGVAYFLQQGEIQAALIWIDHLIDQGHVFLQIADEPVFEGLNNVEGWDNRLARMALTGATHRKHVREKFEAEPPQARD